MSNSLHVKLDRIISYLEQKCGCDACCKDEVNTPAPPPLQEGNWVKGEVTGNIYLIYKLGEITDGFMAYKVNGEKAFIHDCITPHTLTKDDLPDGWFYNRYNEHNHQVTKKIIGWKNHRICTDTEHEAISEALKVHLGQQLLKKAGG